MDKATRAYLKEKVSEKQKEIRRYEALSARFRVGSGFEATFTEGTEDLSFGITLRRVGKRTFRFHDCPLCGQSCQINASGEHRHHQSRKRTKKRPGEWCEAGRWGYKGV